MNSQDASVKGGNRMIGKARKERIAYKIRAAGSVSIADLVREFQVSEMTIRRDLAGLEAQGLIQRAHGGAVVHAGQQSPAGMREPFFDERFSKNLEAKHRIANAAAALVQPSQAIVLDVGTTTYALAQRLAERSDVRIFTNNMRIAALTEEHLAEIYMLGGRVRRREMSLYGAVAIEQVQKLWFDIAFVGISGLSPHGIFDYSIEETELKRHFLDRATRKVILADQSKFDSVSLVRIGALDSFDTLITDAAPPATLMSALKSARVEVIVAGAHG